MQGREYFLNAKCLHVQFTPGLPPVLCSICKNGTLCGIDVKLNRLIISMFHSVPGVPRGKMERFARSRPEKGLSF
jgi:hypothetical protein